MSRRDSRVVVFSIRYCNLHLVSSPSFGEECLEDVDLRTLKE